MPVIKLKTLIKADIEVCFDLSRSIDLHTISTIETKEKAIDGRTTGLIEMNDTVTWMATHFGIRQKLTSKITAFDRPFHFRDEQVRGAFKFMMHDHIFNETPLGTLMEDVFSFQAPFGFIGKITEQLVLTNYLTNFLKKRNEVIKGFAETEKGNGLLKVNR